MEFDFRVIISLVLLHTEGFDSIRLDHSSQELRVLMYSATLCSLCPLLPLCFPWDCGEQIGLPSVSPNLRDMLAVPLYTHQESVQHGGLTDEPVRWEPKVGHFVVVVFIQRTSRLRDLHICLSCFVHFSFCFCCVFIEGFSL